MPEFLKFPDNFLWGAATSAHQAEGGNLNDWSEWEKLNAERLAKEAPAKLQNQVPNWEAIRKEATDANNYISGRAADHYAKYKEDITILKSLNLNAYRFTIEWSRIEPKQGVIDQSAVDHYRSILDELKKQNIEPVVTLWHRTVPLWIRDIGDWSNKNTVDFFARYVQKIVELFGQDINHYTVLNEPMFEIAGAYIGGQYPPQKKNIFLAFKVFHNLVNAHIGAYKIIKQKFPNIQVGIAHAAVYLEAYKNRLLNRLIVKVGHWFMNYFFLGKINQYNDFIGIQYYSRGLLNFGLSGIKQIKTISEQSDMGWEIYPEGLYNFIEMMKRYNKPVMVTENGIADSGDNLRGDYMKQHLVQIHRAINSGAKILGYIYWSYIDNLEWDKGFWPKFGLVEFDRQTYARTIRASAREYAKIAKDKGLTL